MRRPRRSVAVICVAAIALAAVLPGIYLLDSAWIEPVWVLLPAEGPVTRAVPPLASEAQPLPLVSVLVSRGPPTSAALTHLSQR